MKRGKYKLFWKIGDLSSSIWQWISNENNHCNSKNNWFLCVKRDPILVLTIWGVLYWSKIHTLRGIERVWHVRRFNYRLVWGPILLSEWVKRAGELWFFFRNSPAVWWNLHSSLTTGTYCVRTIVRYKNNQYWYTNSVDTNKYRYNKTMESQTPTISFSFSTLLMTVIPLIPYLSHHVLWYLYILEELYTGDIFQLLVVVKLQIMEINFENKTKFP